MTRKEGGFSFQYMQYMCNNERRRVKTELQRCQKAVIDLQVQRGGCLIKGAEPSPSVRVPASATRGGISNRKSVFRFSDLDRWIMESVSRDAFPSVCQRPGFRAIFLHHIPTLI